MGSLRHMNFPNAYCCTTNLLLRVHDRLVCATHVSSTNWYECSLRIQATSREIFDQYTVNQYSQLDRGGNLPFYYPRQCLLDELHWLYNPTRVHFLKGTVGILDRLHNKTVGASISLCTLFWKYYMTLNSLFSGPVSAF